MRLLDASGIAYQAHYYDAADGKIDGLTVAAKIGRESEQVFKTLVTIGTTANLYVFVIPVDRELDLKKAARAAGEKYVEMCPSKDLLKLTGYVHGGCSPLGMKKLCRTFIDESAILQETIVFSAGKIGAQIEAAPDELLAFVQAEYADLVK